MVEVKVPDIGDFTEVEVIEVMVKVGDTVKVDQSLLTVESDKASMEIPSSHAGVVKEIKVKVGDKVAKVAAARAGSGGRRCCGSGSAEPAKLRRQRRLHLHLPQHLRLKLYPLKPHRRSLNRNLPLHPHLLPQRCQPRLLLLPIQRRMHRHRSASSHANWASIWASVNGTGPKGRILQEDVQNYVKSALAAGACNCGSAGASGGGAGLNLLPWPSLDFRNSARPNCSRCRASRKSAARTCIATGS